MTFDSNAPEVHTLVGDDPPVCRDNVRACPNLPSFKRATPRRDRPPHLTPVQPSHETLPTNALALWEQARHPTDTLAESYLDSRGLILPREAAGAAIRFHPSCPFKLRMDEIVRLPAMVALLRTTTGDEPVAVHRTALRGDGRGKATMPDGSEPRRMLGSAAGTAVKFGPDEDVTTCLGIGKASRRPCRCASYLSLAALRCGRSYRPAQSSTFPLCPASSACGSPSITTRQEPERRRAAPSGGARLAGRCSSSKRRCAGSISTTWPWEEALLDRPPLYLIEHLAPEPDLLSSPTTSPGPPQVLRSTGS